ncbi:MAG: lysoplasmalogenase family protein [Pyrinomonadaceae bacterium]
MGVQPYSFLLWSVCIGFAGLCVATRQSSRWIATAVTKMTASTAFVAIALINGALDTDYGVLVLAALVFSWFGDLFLLSERYTFVLGGIAAFFLAHVAFAAAFSRLFLDIENLTFALAVLLAVGLAILWWLWRHLSGLYRAAVPAYLIAIVAMSSLAIAANRSPTLPLAAGAILFAISDVTVAEDRFIKPGRTTAWGLPLYYLAQLLLAGSVIAVR